MTDADHDILIKVVGSLDDLRASNNEKFADLKSDIKELKDGHAGMIADHETRLRRLELWGGMAIGGLAVIQIVLAILK